MIIPTRKNLRNYVTIDGKVPFQEWLNNLDVVIRTRIKVRLDRLELGNFGDHSSLGDGVAELRLFFGAGYRIYYAEQDEIIILLCGGNKKTQKHDIKLAKSYFKELEARE